MKKLFALFLSSLIATSALATNWRYIGEGDSSQMYINTEDKSTRVIDGNTLIGVWFKIIEENPSKSKIGDMPFEWGEIKLWVNCADKTMAEKPTDAKFYNKEGELVFSGKLASIEKVKFKPIDFNKDLSSKNIYKSICNSN